MLYEVDDRVWLNSKNISTKRPCKNLKNKKLNFYKIIEKIGAFYRLKFSESFKFYNVFGSNALRLFNDNSLFDQRKKSLKFVVILKSNE